MSLIKCPECGGMLSDKAAACPSCGAPNNLLHIPKCNSCNSIISPAARYCPNCGSKQLADETEEPVKGRLYPYLIATAAVLIFIIIAIVVIKQIDRPVDASIASADSGKAAIEEAEYMKAKTALQKKNELLHTERSNPGKYLKLESSSKNNLIGETVISGTLSSAATLASYRNSKLKVTFFNKKGEELGREEILLTDTIAPGQSIEYRQKITGPKGNREAEVVLVSAVGK